MHLSGVLQHFRKSTAYQTWLSQHRPQNALTIIRSARPFLLATLAQDWQGAIVYVTARGRRAYNVAEQLPVWLGNSQRIHRWAEPTPMFYDRLAWDKAVIQERLTTLGALLNADEAQTPPIVITSARALMQRTLPPHQLRHATQTLRIKQSITPQKLISDWVAHGYEPVTQVVETGTFSKRGDVVDIFPIQASNPIRIDFFGDEIEKIRTFDPTTQRSKTPLEQVQILPAREVLPAQTPQLASYLSRLFANKYTEEGELIGTHQDLDALQAGQAFPFLEHYLPYIVPQPSSLLDHAPENALILLEDVEDIATRIAELEETAQNNKHNNLTSGQLESEHPLPYLTWQQLEASLSERNTLTLTNNPTDNTTRFFAPARRFSGQLRQVVSATQETLAQNHPVVVVSAQIDRLRDVWQDQVTSDFVPKVVDITLPPTALTLVEGELSEGWHLLADSPLLLITDSEIFNWERPEPRRRKSETRPKASLTDSSYSDWKEGEYVVHVDYGIGKFTGLQKRTLEGNEREYIVLVYEDNDSVFVPVHQADRLTRYVGTNDVTPRLSNISKPTEWAKAKERARQNAEEEARELLDIYAKRAHASGYAYRPDTPYQHELEASFPFVETEDQVRALREIKADMEASAPMDRLVCGDVGYGKTEVALRAAFKAVMDGKQVAVLVPTTILADQHYHTFQRRMEAFGVVVELMSRFRTAREQSEILTRLANGKVDIIVGTHRILGEDITLPNLGLVIIDEEQRFGVKQKEHFKKLRAQTDILTLTATPIPRTLYMSLSGVRDISMIQTPPEERLPVVTHVGAFEGKLARQAILRELDRGGQVFVIHNRVKTLDSVREKFESLVPEASIIVAHGQMSGKQLEAIISEFGRGRYDILIATSIIENGIDMPNVNTLIVDRAEWFGLSQLYQIRGRVGRGAQQAYAYFFHAKGGLSEEARQRLDTLAEYTALGVGFQIAIRDLEIRGSGDILSMKQSGHVQVVGLQLYSQLLAHAVNRLKTERGQKVTSLDNTISLPSEEKVTIDLPIVAYIPETWIPEMALRLQIYRRIGHIRELADIEALRSELTDRFGKLPNAVEGLLYQVHLKLLATRIYATAIIKPREQILIKVGWLNETRRNTLGQLFGKDVQVSRTAFELTPSPQTWRTRLLELLIAIQPYSPVSE